MTVTAYIWLIIAMANGVTSLLLFLWATEDYAQSKQVSSRSIRDNLAHTGACFSRLETPSQYQEFLKNETGAP